MGEVVEDEGALTLRELVVGQRPREKCAYEIRWNVL